MTADKVAAESTSVRHCLRPDAEEENLSSLIKSGTKAYQQFEFTSLSPEISNL